MKKVICFILAMALLIPITTYAAVDFDAVDDVATAGIALSNFIAAANGTATIWFKATGAPTLTAACDGAHKLVSDDNGYMHIALRLVTATATLCVDNYDGTYDVVNVAYTSGTLTHVAWKHTGGVLEIFINGASAGTIASGDTQDISHLLEICGNCNSRVYQVEMFNVALSAAEINVKAKARTFNAGWTKPTALWTFLNCAEGANGDLVVIPDRSGNGRNITLNNGANNTGMTCRGSDVLSKRMGVQ